MIKFREYIKEITTAQDAVKQRIAREKEADKIKHDRMMDKARLSDTKKVNKQPVEEVCWSTHKQIGLKKKGGKMVPNCVPKKRKV